MWNQIQIFEKQLIFYLKPEFPWKVFKIRFENLFSDQAFWDFLDTCITFSAVCKKRFINQSFEVLGIVKEYDKNFN